MSLSNALLLLSIVLACLGILLCQFTYKLIKIHDDIKSLRHTLGKYIKPNDITNKQTNKNNDIISGRPVLSINPTDNSCINGNTENKLNTCLKKLIYIFASSFGIIKHGLYMNQPRYSRTE